WVRVASTRAHTSQLFDGARLRHRPERGAGLEEVLERAAGYDVALLEKIDDVAVTHRGDAVGDHHDGLQLAQRAHGLEDALLGEAVKRTGSFVENEYRRVVIQGPGDAEP